YTAEGPISYWNAYVAVTQMGGQGNFSDPRLGIDVKHSPDMVTSHLPALRAYQHSLPPPPPPAGSFDAAGAERGRAVFGRTCASCQSADPARTTTTERSIRPRTREWTARTRRAPPARPIARRLCARSGS